MSISTEYSRLKTVTVSERELKKESVSLRLSDNKSVGFSKVLNKTATLFVESVEVREDEVNYTLGVNTSVIFVDLKGEIRNSSYSGSVSKTLNIDGIKQSDGVILRCVLDDLAIDKIVGEDLTLQLDYTVNGLIFESGEYDALTDVDGAYAKKCDLKYLKSAKISRFDLSFEESVEGIADLESVLAAEAEFTAIEGSAKTDGIDISGEILARITYKTTAEGNELKTVEKRFNVKESLEIAATEDCDSVMVFPHSKLTFTSVDESDGTLDIRCEFALVAAVLKTDETSVVTEVFSKKYELLPSYEVVGFNSLDGTLSVEGSDNATYSVEDLEGVVAALGTKAELINLTTLPQSVDADVLATVSSIINVDGSYIARDLDVPITVTVPTDGADREYVARLSTVSSSVTAGNDSVTAFVKTRVTLYAISSDTVSLITSLETGEEKPTDVRAIVVYIAKGGESEIDLAKAVNMTPDEIAAQQTLTYPLDPSARIVLYRQRLPE